MHTVSAIFNREIRGTFGSASAYVVLGVFMGLLSVVTLFFDDVLQDEVASMQATFEWIGLCFLFLVPAVTMRTLAEERRSGSLEILSTLPVTPAQIVLGKWLAATFLIATALALTITWPLAISQYGQLDWGPVLGGYLGLLLMGGAFAAIGTAASALTDSQIFAFLGAFVVCLVPFMTGTFLASVPGDLVPLVQYLTFDYHFANLARGVIDSRSLVFYGGVIAVGLRVAVLALEQRRLA